MSIDNKPTSANSDEQLRRQRRFYFLIILGIIVLSLLFQQYGDYLFGSFHKKPPVPVEVSKAITANVPVYIWALGGVTPDETVTVRTQVNGRLFQVLFQEGQMVKAGDVLAIVDPRPYQAQLLQYQGQYARDVALLNNAKLDLHRYQTLWKQNSISKQTLDTQASLVAQDEGTVKLDEGLIYNTQVNLSYCWITAPISGRVGLQIIDAGNFVQTSDVNGIVIINKLSPIEVLFSIPEDDVPDVMDQINAHKPLAVFAYDRTQTRLLATGTLETIDNQIDPTTGTVKLEGIFQNEHNELFPNQFVNTALLLKTIPNAIVVPTAAIQHGPSGLFVYVVNKNKTVSVKKVSTDVTSGENTIVKSGVLAGQMVVIDGVDKLTDGAPVIVSGNVSPSILAKANTQKSFFVWDKKAFFAWSKSVFSYLKNEYFALTHGRFYV